MPTIESQGAANSASTPTQSPATAINANRALWEKGDFTRLAATMRESGDEVVESLGVGPGMDVLDLGCGDGTTALPAAMRGASVLGVDIAANLVAAGQARAVAAGLGVVFHRRIGLLAEDPQAVAVDQAVAFGAVPETVEEAFFSHDPLGQFIV